MEPNRTSPEKEDYGSTGRTRKKPDATPTQGPAPVHRGASNDTARPGAGKTSLQDRAV